MRRRRTPGLRREEVAELAGIGTDWYTRLEQGRDVQPSIATIDALAQALRLSDAEREHLRRLARVDRRAPFTTETVPPALARIVATMPFPAYITGQRWDLLTWNDAAADLFMDFGKMLPTERNILVYMLTEPSARSMFGTTWTNEARRMVSQFRNDFGAWVGDPAFENLVVLLSDRSAQFRKWWSTHEVRGQAAGRKLLHHPTFGDSVAEYVTLQSNDDRRLKLIMYRIMERSDR